MCSVARRRSRLSNQCPYVSYKLFLNPSKIPILVQLLFSLCTLTLRCSHDFPQVPTSNDPFAAPPPQPNQSMNIPPLTKAPKWLRRPCGVSFGFGGKLISFDSTSTQVGDYNFSHLAQFSNFKIKAKWATVLTILPLS